MSVRDALLSLLDIGSGETTTHDPYDALCAMFTIANTLYWLDPNSVPAAWEFRQGAGGGIDYAECPPDDGTGCPLHCGECETPRMLLAELGANLADPYGDENGLHAERELIALGNALNETAALWQG